MVWWVNMVDALIDASNALSLDELSETYASIVPREKKCNRFVSLSKYGRWAARPASFTSIIHGKTIVK